MKQLIAFDLDDTLAITKSPISDLMADKLHQLLQRYQVCVISGGQFEQFQRQLLDQLRVEHHLLLNLHLMPTCGTRYYRFDDISQEWKLIYKEDLSDSQKRQIIEVLETEAKSLGIWRKQTWGPIIEDRLSQITYSALGQQAPPEEKYAWAEANSELKHNFRLAVSRRLPDLEVRLGGSTSVDVTRPGIDKAYGMEKLMQQLEIGIERILFIGDRLEEGGNDSPVKSLGIDCLAVESCRDTELIIETICKFGD